VYIHIAAAAAEAAALEQDARTALAAAVDAAAGIRDMI